MKQNKDCIDRNGTPIWIHFRYTPQTFIRDGTTPNWAWGSNISFINDFEYEDFLEGTNLVPGDMEA